MWINLLWLITEQLEKQIPTKMNSLAVISLASYHRKLDVYHELELLTKAIYTPLKSDVSFDLIF